MSMLNEWRTPLRPPVARYPLLERARMTQQTRALLLAWMGRAEAVAA